MTRTTLKKGKFPARLSGKIHQSERKKRNHQREKTLAGRIR